MKKGAINGLLLSLPIWLCICAIVLSIMSCVLPTAAASNNVKKPITGLSGFTTPTAIATHSAEVGKMVICLSAETVYLRSGAGKSFEALDVLISGTKVTLLDTPTIAEDMGVWYEVQAGDIRGFVNARYLCTP